MVPQFSATCWIGTCPPDSRIADTACTVRIEPGCAAERHEDNPPEATRPPRPRPPPSAARPQPSGTTAGSRPKHRASCRRAGNCGFPHERRRAVRLESNAGDADDTAGAEHQPAGRATGKDGRWLARRGLGVEAVERVAEVNDQLRTSIGEHRLQRPGQLLRVSLEAPKTHRTTSASGGIGGNSRYYPLPRT